MKTLAIVAIISAATVGTVSANDNINAKKANTIEVDTREAMTAAFMDELSFQQWNIDVLWNQYSLGEKRIKSRYDSVAELNRQKDYFISLYKQDIADGVRVLSGYEAILEIEEIYRTKIAKQQKIENKKVATLQGFLKRELKNEENKLAALKSRYAKYANAETDMMIDQLENQLANAIDKLEDSNEISAVAAL